MCNLKKKKIKILNKILKNKYALKSWFIKKKLWSLDIVIVNFVP